MQLQQLCFWGAGLTSVSADQITAQAATSEVVSETSSPDDSSEALLESEKAVDVNQTIETVNASDVVDNSESQSTEPESPVVEETEPESLPQEVISQTQEVQGTAATAEIADVKTVTSAENSNQVNLLKSSQPDNQVSNPPIAEDTIRVHFQAVTDDNYTQYGLWTWGAIAEPSDGNNWPAAATPFSANQKDDFGYYIDVRQAASHGDIGYLLLKNGEKTSDSDQSIKPLSKDVNEVWVTSDFMTYSYKPLADDRIIRINYKRDDGNYDGWGLWAWGDVAGQFGAWPSDALDFNQEGAYGRYIDLPLSKLLDSNIGFLLVNQNDPEKAGNKTLDMSFSDRDIHSQIFLHNDDATVYTNPYYITTVTGQDFSKATP
ncbi:peptidoglycan linked protein(LPXTGmotif), pullulanase [Streptococcus infantarius subsp. infantarius]|nr:peptidoglycan linked protein(LPXTGmotif), pullulanase [Streptococcus infantarius subsp. infantarius]